MRASDRRAVEGISIYLARSTGTPDPVTLARVISDAVGATGCVLTVAGERHQWGADMGSWWQCEVYYDNELQGSLAVAPETIGPLPGTIAALGVPFAVIRLAAETDQLRRAGDQLARQLADDRWRVTAEMEQERRRLERDLHDGAQHHLVALRLALALLEDAEDPALVRLVDVLNRLDSAKRVLVDTAAGILPVALANGGLGAALTAELADSNVTLDISGLLSAHPPVVESAIYFTCMEAVNNARKHAKGADIAVTVRDSQGFLEFSVIDNGPGFSTPAKVSGLDNLRSRIATVGGTVEIKSSPRGTIVTGKISA